MATTTIPEKLYVTVQYRSDVADNDGGLLGFASPYTKDAAFEKRKSTQDSWAYGYGSEMEITDTDSVIIKTVPSNAKWDKTSLFVYRCQPRIIKNEPVEGFEIAKSVRRYGWNGSGNVKWRITDPRGFDLEISSENFASVIDCVDMEKGLIKGKCAWGRQGSQNILLPEVSEPYKAAHSLTVKVNSKISLKDVQPGDVVEVLTTKVVEADAVAVYCGKMYFLVIEYGRDDSHDYRNSFTGEYFLAHEQKEAYLFKSVSSGNYFTIGSSPKIVNIVTKAAAPIDKKVLAAEANNYAKTHGSSFGDVSRVLLVSDSKIDFDKIEVAKALVTGVDESNWPVVDSYYHRSYLAEYDGKEYITNMPTTWSLQRGESLALFGAEFKPAERMIKRTQRYVTDNRHVYSSYYSNRYVTTELDTVKNVDMSKLKLYDVQVKYNGLDGVVLHLDS